MNTKAGTCNEQNVKLFRLSVNSRLFKQCQDFDKMIQARKSSQSKPMIGHSRSALDDKITPTRSFQIKVKIAELIMTRMRKFIIMWEVLLG